MTQLEGLVPGTWTIDPAHTEIGFTVRHLVSKVRGRFEEFEGEFVIAEDPRESAASATIQLNSVNTATKQRDDHLRSSDFFGVEENPVMTFRSTGVRADGDDYVLTGELTVKGVTRQVDLDVVFLGTGPGTSEGEIRAGFEATAKVNRKDFGLTYNFAVEGGKLVIGDQVTIHLLVEAILQKAAEPAGL
jgi:polyisoprenoid-binding protein YceI